MKNNKLKIRIASAALSLIMSGSAGFSLSRPAYALDDENEEQYEQQSNIGEENEFVSELDFVSYDELNEYFDEEVDAEEEEEEEEDNVEENNIDMENEIDSNVQEEEENTTSDDVTLTSVENEDDHEVEDVIVTAAGYEDEVNEDVIVTAVENEDANSEEQVNEETNLDEGMLLTDEEGNELVLSKNLVEKLDEAIEADTKSDTEDEQAAASDDESEDNTNENSQNENTSTTAKVAVITTKTDDKGNALVGATLQILDMDGNVLDEWISDGTEHVSMLPAGQYILKETNAPEGYLAAKDQEFTIETDINDVTAGVNHDESGEVCWHYGGVPLYFVECEGEHEEVYCVNQGWEEPNDTIYDGAVLDETNIRAFTPDADTEMTDAELYNKVLDIIYHRSKVEELFPDLSEVEIRFITEYALKTYTSAEVTTQQAKRDENGKIIRDEDGNIVYEDIKFLRYYSYDPTNPKGYVIDPENGNGIGKLAEHWYNQHGKTQIPAEYVELFNYLISTDDAHPEDMILYIYSTSTMTEDGEKYQNLLGVKWFDSYDEEIKTYLTVVDKKKQSPPPPPPGPPCPPPKPGYAPKTGDNSNLFIYSLALLGSSTCAIPMIYYLDKEYKKDKVKARVKVKE